MPYLTVYTNAEIKNNAQLAEKASQITAEILHKPISYVVVNVIYNSAMAFGGTTANQGALLELQSIGLGDKDKIVTELTTFFARELNIKEQRYVNIVLVDCPAAFVASNGRTFG